MKGKNRIILITKSLRKKLTKYYKEKNISFGEIFLTKNGTSLDRRQIWREMKQLCQNQMLSKQKYFLII